MSINSDDTQNPTRRSKAGSKGTSNSRQTEDTPADYNNLEAQTLEGTLMEVLQCDALETHIRSDQARDALISWIKAQNHGSVSASAYIHELKKTVAALRGAQQRQHRKTQSHRSTGDAIRDEHPEKNGWNLELKSWKKVNNRYGSADIYDESEKIEDIRKREREIRSGGHVLSVYDEYDYDGNKMQVLLEINSSPLLELLRQVITFYPGDEYDVLRGKDSMDDAVTFSDPFMIFFAYRKQLQQSLHGDFADDANQHVEMLLNFLKTERPTTSAKLTEIEEGRCRKISFDKIWLLYPPNTPVYSCKGSDDCQIVVYSRQATEWTSKGPNGTLKLTCWEVNYEQNIFKRDFSEWCIEPYSGEKNIGNLELVPVQYMRAKKRLHNKLVERGQHYFELNKEASLQDYYGDRFPRVYKDVRFS